MRSLIAIFSHSCLFMMAFGALAQSVSPPDIDAQNIHREAQRLHELRQQQEVTPDVGLGGPKPGKPALPLPVDEATCFPIHTLALQEPSRHVSSSFQWLLAAANKAADGSPDPVTGKCLGAQAINIVMKRMQNALVARGYITTRVLAPSQDLGSGVLTLTLIPGRIRAIRFSDDTPTRATGWNALPVRPGDVLNLRDLEQALENFKRLPTADADIQITPASDPDAQPGDSDVVIHWRQGLPFRLNIGIDDSGMRTTGKYLGSFTVSFDHWLTLNDLFYLSLRQSLGSSQAGQRELQGQTIHYSAPLGYWLLGFTANRSEYRQVVAGLNQSYVYSGDSSHQEVRLSRLVFRNAARKTTLYAAGWLRESHNAIDDTELLTQHRRMAGWEIGMAERHFIGASTLDLGLGWRRGTGALGARRAPGEALGEGTSRSQILTASVQFHTPFTLGDARLRYRLNGRGQWTDTPLVPQDRFSIGSRFTVRGFGDERSLMADRGWILRNELSGLAGSSAQELYVGVDIGAVSGRGIEFLPGRRLSGIALGLRGGVAKVGYDVFIGRPLSAPAGFKEAAYVVGFNLNVSY